MIKNLLFVLLLLGSQACQKSLAPSNTNSSLTYLALGDSYTIGESVSGSERWPIQLIYKLNEAGIEVSKPTIIAKTGWTTDELNAAIDKANLNDKYDLVSLLIGVNNQYRGRSLAQYENEFEGLLARSVGLAGNDPSKVFVVSIPDYGVTPFAKNRNPIKIGNEITAFNMAQKAICEKYQVPFYDITPYSQTAKNNLNLVASDGLHPSGEMYKGWVEIFFEDVLNQLK